MRLALLCAPVLLCASPARASVVERVVAVVGEHAILLSDLRARARPFLLRIHRQLPRGAQRTAATSQLYKVLLERMVDEQLQQRAAARAHIAVSASEIDQAIARVAAQNGLTVEQIMNEAVRNGMNEPAYRREIRRQVLDAKMMNLRLQGRIRITEDDLRSAYRLIVMDERRRLGFRAAWIVVRTPRAMPAARLKRKRALAEQIAERAQRGADFGALARRHSDDSDTAKAGGLLGRLRFGRLPRAVDKALLQLEVGQVSPPLRLRDRLVIVKLIERDKTNLPSFEEAAEELHQRVYMEKMAKARRHWLDGLRRRMHVEIRL